MAKTTAAVVALVALVAVGGPQAWVVVSLAAHAGAALVVVCAGLRGLRRVG